MKIIYAVLTSGKQVFHPAFQGALKGTLSETSHKPALEMALCPQGVEIKYKGRTVIVPVHMFDFVEVVADAKKTK